MLRPIYLSAEELKILRRMLDYEVTTRKVKKKKPVEEPTHTTTYINNMIEKMKRTIEQNTMNFSILTFTVNESYNFAWCNDEKAREIILDELYTTIACANIEQRKKNALFCLADFVPPKYQHSTGDM